MRLMYTNKLVYDRLMVIGIFTTKIYKRHFLLGAKPLFNKFDYAEVFIRDRVSQS